MSLARQNSNLAARVGRWSAAHWKTATFGWLALVLLVFAVGSQVGTKQADPNRAGPGESGRMDRVLDAGFKVPASESVLIQSRSLRVGALSFDAAVKDVVTRLEKVAAVQNVRSPLERANAGRIATGGHAALVEFEIRGDSTKAADKLGPILQSVTGAQRAHPGLFVGEFGGASAAKAVDTAFANDLKSAGVFSVPLTLIILVIAFGALVAAGIPLLLALTAVFATFGLAALPSHLLPIAPEAFAVDRLHVPLVGRLRRDEGEGRIWGAIVDRVLRRPLLSAVIAGGLLLAIAAPALQLRMATPGPDTFPKSLDVVKTYDRMQHAFPGTALPAYVVVKAPDVNAPAVREAIRRLKLAALATGRARGPITNDTNKDGTIANITVPILGKGTDAQSNASLAALREDVLPHTVGALPNAQSGVTGLTAEWKDQKDQLRSKLPLVVAFVLLLAFGLMLVAFRSIVVAIKAIVLNLISVAAGYGVLVLVFQHGIGKGLLGFSSTAGIDPVTPLLLFVIPSAPAARPAPASA